MINTSEVRRSVVVDGQMRPRGRFGALKEAFNVV